MPGVRATRTMPVPSARMPAAIGGRFGPRRTTSSRVYRTRTGAAVLVGEAAGDRADLAGRPCRRTPRRWPAASPARRPARTTTRRARGSPARPTSSAACGTQSPGGTSSGHVSGAVERRPWTRPAARRASVSVSATCHVAVVAADGDEGVGRRACRRRSRRRRPRGPTRWAVRPSSGARASQRPSRPSAPARSGRPERTATASTIGCQPVQRHRWAARARCDGRRRRPRRPASARRRASRCPACRTRTARRRRRRTLPPTRSASGRPSSVVTSRPATRAERRHAGDARAGRRSRPCSSRTGPAGCSRPSASARRGGRAGLRGARRRRRRPRRPAVEAERDQLKLWPQPQVRVAFGFVMANPDWSRPSL